MVTLTTLNLLWYEECWPQATKFDKLVKNKIVII